MLAACHGSSRVIEILLCAKADVNTCVTAGEVGHISRCLEHAFFPAYQWLEHAIFSCLSVI